jgi:hypothetical protein
MSMRIGNNTRYRKMVETKVHLENNFEVEVEVRCDITLLMVPNL